MTVKKFAVTTPNDGILRWCANRGQAVNWAMKHTGTTKVVARFSYGHGLFEYLLGSNESEDGDGGIAVTIVREDVTLSRGFDATQKPLYPSPVNPYERRDRD